jgi:hypothetical protein
MKYPYGKIQKLNDSLHSNKIDPDIINEIMKDGEKINPTDKNEQKADWFLNAVNIMDIKLDPSTRYKVREGCACCLGGKRHEVCKQINKKFTTKKERIEEADRTHIFGNGLKEIEKGKYEVSFFPDSLGYTTCPCLRGFNKAMPITYCYCCGGHVKYHLETVLGLKLEVKVITSALSTKGQKGCKFELTESE